MNGAPSPSGPSIDFAAAVAVGAIVGRTAIAEGQSYAVGAVALLSIVAVHRLASLLRFRPLFTKLTDHRVRVLVADGKVRPRQLRICGLTDGDLFAELRLKGVFDVRELRYVLYEAKGGLTIVRREDEPGSPLVDVALRSSTGYTERAPSDQESG